MDVGSGNGYFAWRMRESRSTIRGLSRTKFSFIYSIPFLNHFADDVKIRFLPMTLEDSVKGNVYLIKFL